MLVHLFKWGGQTLCIEQWIQYCMMSVYLYLFFIQKQRGNCCENFNFFLKRFIISSSSSPTIHPSINSAKTKLAYSTQSCRGFLLFSSLNWTKLIFSLPVFLACNLLFYSIQKRERDFFLFVSCCSLLTQTCMFVYISVHNIHATK